MDLGLNGKNALVTGVQVFAETAAIELAPYGIRVNTVSSGLINSPNWAKGVLSKAATDPDTGADFMNNLPPSDAWACLPTWGLRMPSWRLTKPALRPAPISSWTAASPCARWCWSRKRRLEK